MLADPIIFDFCIMGQHAYSTGPAKKEKTKIKGKDFSPLFSSGMSYR